MTMTNKRSAALQFLLLLTACCTMLPFTSFAQAAVDTNNLARELVEKADRIRFPAEGFQVEISITSTAPEKEAEVRQYQILSKGNEQTLIRTTEPAEERGQVLLMKGRDLWVFMPNVSQPIRLPLAQRLTGQVANGDLARANFTGDYTPALVRNETIDGESYYLLELTGVDRGVTYHRVLYWINQSNNWPYKAEFYTLSGRLMKTCFYEAFREMEGAIRPTRLVMINALREGEKSVLEYSDMQLRELPDKFFTKDYLKKLQ